MVFNADEVLGIAVTIERNGQEFYRKASELVEEETAKSLMSNLANWEGEHEKKFLALREKFAADREREMAVDPNSEAEKYLNAIANGKVFKINESAEAAIGTSTATKEILEKAMVREKDAVIFYTAIKEIAASRDDRLDIDRIIKEEMSHVVMLADMIANISS